MAHSEARVLAIGAVITAVVATAAGAVSYHYLGPPSGGVPKEFAPFVGHSLTVPGPADRAPVPTGSPITGSIQWGSSPPMQIIGWVPGDATEQFVKEMNQAMAKGSVVLGAPRPATVNGHPAELRATPAHNLLLLTWFCPESDRSFGLTMVAPGAEPAELDGWMSQVSAGVQCHH